MDNKTNERFKGIFTALLTPFDGNGRIMDNSLEQLINFNIKKGVKGFYINGSTAETFMMTPEEKKHVLETAKAVAGDRVTMIAHVGCISTEQSVELARYAERLGYDAVSAVAPFYYKFSLAELKQHYTTIARSVTLKMLLYNFPAFSGVSLSSADIIDMLRSDCFLGIKHTSSDFFALEQVKTACPDKLVYNGYDEMFLPGLVMGADGGIGSTYNFMAEKFIKIAEDCQNGRIESAKAVQQEVNRIINILCKVGVMEGEKLVLGMMGINMGHAKAPFAHATKEQIDLLQREIVDRL